MVVDNGEIKETSYNWLNVHKCISIVYAARKACEKMCLN